MNDAPRNNPFKTLPHNLEAEQGLLGAILHDNNAYDTVSEYLAPEHFATKAHARIFHAIQHKVERHEVVDPLTLKDYFEHNDTLEQIGGWNYLVELAGAAVTIINAAEYGRVIHDRYLSRELIEVGQQVVNDSYDPSPSQTAMERIENAEQQLYDVATSGSHTGGFSPLKETMIKSLELAEFAHQSDGRLLGVTTGLADLDVLLGGLRRSDLVILAGRPAMGKTALAVNIGQAAARAHKNTDGKQGAVVGMFSLEMSEEQVGIRMLADQSEISSDTIQKGKVKADDFPRIVASAQGMYDVPFFIDDTAGITVSAMRTRARRMKRQHNLGLIIVDYLQLIEPPKNNRNDGRVQEVSAITRSLKILARELDVPVIALSQLSRQVENRDDKRPQLADLRDSGSIEQDADVVMFIYRDEYYLAKAEPLRRMDEAEDKYNDRYQRWEDRLDAVRNVAEIIVAKQRHGPVGTVKALFEGAYTRFRDLDDRHMNQGNARQPGLGGITRNTRQNTPHHNRGT